MVDTNTIVSDTNAKIIGSVSSVNLMKVLGWIFFIIIVIAICTYAYIIWNNKRIYKRKITAFDIVGINFVPAIRDVAKPVKIGSGGFEILYLKKLKIYKIAYGGKVGKDTYYFFIMPDGYWYNGMLSANIMAIDKNGGLIQVVTTNPTMRSQYTSLEKQIDILHEHKQSVWDKYGSWILSIGFVVISGVMLWLSYKEFRGTMDSLAGVVASVGDLVDKIATLQGGATPTGLVKVA
jgi:hypothetical protein